MYQFVNDVIRAGTSHETKVLNLLTRRTRACVCACHCVCVWGGGGGGRHKAGGGGGGGAPLSGEGGGASAPNAPPMRTPLMLLLIKNTY